ncbi:methionyl-tRNA formyltransferase [Paraclostridium ghonii]|uniref:Methionyl-tRNA formyltransferase n=1 Tax=Paraclostridium ghonii TaxID=29358 RepID=A0ABU0MZ89_9FIRM|nr:methionyl-tRNA formyltransferase [Paeniclostridium ghonii]MDQ0556229.1 methionyl-tRNA formyltransferase [Paeniclostridium ghonii]
MNILFMGGHELGSKTLEYLISNNVNIVGVVVSKNGDDWYRGVDEVANKFNLDLYEEKNINDQSFLNKIKLLYLDLIVCVNFDQILKKDIINLPTMGCINTHASLLPRYRGRAPLNWSMINGEQYSGVTVHFIDEGIDTGDIILQEKIKIDEDDYISDLLNKVKNTYPKIVLSAIQALESNNINLIKPDLSKGFYVNKRTKADGKIDFSKSSKDIVNFIKAISKPYPGAFLYYNNKKIIIWRATLNYDILPKYENLDIGTVIFNDFNLCIKLRDSMLIVTEYEFE